MFTVVISLNIIQSNEDSIFSRQRQVKIMLILMLPGSTSQTENESTIDIIPA